jgi:hypothetical protein
MVVAGLLCSIVAVAFYVFSTGFAGAPATPLYAGMTFSLGAEPVRADFGAERASADARQVAGWVIASRDNNGLPFVIIDKAAARVFVFHADGRLRGASAALLGMGRGDEFAPGVREKDMKETLPDERVTPAGRFEAERGAGVWSADLLWIDYDSAIALHPLNPHIGAGQRRKERLDSPAVEDNRITYGCVNVPVAFYRDIVQPAFEATRGIVYVLPETRPAMELFGSSAVQRLAR